MSAASAPNHRRTKPGGIKPGVAANNGVNLGPTSQIPGLSQSADESAPEARTSGRRVGIFASDSDYVKLAKAGGQKGLLSHEDLDEVPQKPQKTYNPASNWFSGSPQDSTPASKRGSKATTPSKGSTPDILSPEGNGNKSVSRGGAPLSAAPLSAPFGTDNCSSWERETDSFAYGKDKVDSATHQLDSMSIAQVNKHKRVSYDKKAPPVSMSKLLSFGYMEDENKSPNDDDASSVTTEQTSTIATEDVDDDLE